ncbi:hypothetical protein AGLY_008280 [Aphis glycines]|uniref:Uncharacterized protein n=1 Tax=Aphis glycines TaxID=307491 RepID=A0A6G0TLK6_APHGL|nr:hypothetical protein AGLY_008280 [Aphis glycines]
MINLSGDNDYDDYTDLELLLCNKAFSVYSLETKNISPEIFAYTRTIMFLEPTSLRLATVIQLCVLKSQRQQIKFFLINYKRHFYGCIKFEFNYISWPTKHDSELSLWSVLTCNNRCIMFVIVEDNKNSLKLKLYNPHRIHMALPFINKMISDHLWKHVFPSPALFRAHNSTSCSIPLPFMYVHRGERLYQMQCVSAATGLYMSGSEGDFLVRQLRQQYCPESTTWNAQYIALTTVTILHQARTNHLRTDDVASPVGVGWRRTAIAYPIVNIVVLLAMVSAKQSWIFLIFFEGSYYYSYRIR